MAAAFFYLAIQPVRTRLELVYFAFRSQRTTNLGKWSPAFSNRNFVPERVPLGFALCRCGVLSRNDVTSSRAPFRAIVSLGETNWCRDHIAQCERFSRPYFCA